MDSFIAPIIIGIVCIIIGILNAKGNISSLHWYHRKRVSEADRIPFGKMIGIGTIIIGISIIVYSGLSIASEILKNDIFILIGVVILIIGIVVGLILNIYAMIKYNKGIF